jgi:predicted nucleic acid-binding protein
VLEQISRIVEQVDRSLYEEHQSAARERIDPRDPDDWPVVATALLLDLPIWTEDQDFFGSGVATGQAIGSNSIYRNIHEANP